MLKGISGDGGSVEVDAVDSGIASARGSACSMKWTAAELLDTTRGRTGGGEHGYDEGTAMVASAMAGEREREGLGENGGVLGVHSVAWSSSIQPRGEEVKQGDGQLRGASCGRRRAPACLPGRQAARWSGAGLGRQVGRVLAPCKFSIISFFLFFVFLMLLQLC